MMKKRKDEDKKPVEQEVAELQRKFRVLENDKRAYSEDSQGIIRKQRATIEKLTRENRAMKQELAEVRKSDRGGVEARRGAETLAKIAEHKEQLMTVHEAPLWEILMGGCTREGQRTGQSARNAFHVSPPRLHYRS